MARQITIVSRVPAALLGGLLALGGAGAPSPAAPISGLDVLQLEISFSTIAARFYRPIAARDLATGARTSIATVLVKHGVSVAHLPAVPQRLDPASGADYVASLVLGSLARYPQKLDGHALVAAAASGELSALHDPYSVLFQPQEFKKFDAFLGNKSFGGIGAVLTLEGDRALIESTLADAPAQKAGLAPGDAIAGIDGVPVSHYRSPQALLAVLRGKIGTHVSLAVVKRSGENVKLDLVRRAVVDPEVETRRYDDVAYLRLTRFGDRAGAEVAAALAAATRGGARAYVLDLRGNGGGYGDEAVKVASCFIRTGTIYTTRERNAPPVVAKATGTATFSAPLVVLVDGDTASASEIVAGALQDYGLATVVGTRTFGKGLVQSIFPLPDGSAMKLTTARYVTPKGRDIDGVGIMPDRVVTEPGGAHLGDPSTDAQLSAALALFVASPQPSAAASQTPLPSPAPSGRGS